MLASSRGRLSHIQSLENAMTLGQRAHNVHPYGLYGENACFNMF